MTAIPPTPPPPTYLPPLQRTDDLPTAVGEADLPWGWQLNSEILTVATQIAPNQVELVNLVNQHGAWAYAGQTLENGTLPDPTQRTYTSVRNALSGSEEWVRRAVTHDPADDWVHEAPQKVRDIPPVKHTKQRNWVKIAAIAGGIALGVGMIGTAIAGNTVMKPDKEKLAQDSYGLTPDSNQSQITLPPDFSTPETPATGEGKTEQDALIEQSFALVSELRKSNNPLQAGVYVNVDAQTGAPNGVVVEFAATGQRLNELEDEIREMAENMDLFLLTGDNAGALDVIGTPATRDHVVEISELIEDAVFKGVVPERRADGSVLDDDTRIKLETLAKYGPAVGDDAKAVVEHWDAGPDWPNGGANVYLIIAEEGPDWSPERRQALRDLASSTNGIEIDGVRFVLGPVLDKDITDGTQRNVVTGLDDFELENLRMNRSSTDFGIG